MYKIIGTHGRPPPANTTRPKGSCLKRQLMYLLYKFWVAPELTLGQTSNRHIVYLVVYIAFIYVEIHLKVRFLDSATNAGFASTS